jgi:hypothetical protein
LDIDYLLFILQHRQNFTDAVLNSLPDIPAGKGKLPAPITEAKRKCKSSPGPRRITANDAMTRYKMAVANPLMSPFSVISVKIPGGLVVLGLVNMTAELTLQFVQIYTFVPANLAVSRCPLIDTVDMTLFISQSQRFRWRDHIAANPLADTLCLSIIPDIRIIRPSC